MIQTAESYATFDFVHESIHELLETLVMAEKAISTKGLRVRCPGCSRKLEPTKASAHMLACDQVSVWFKKRIKAAQEFFQTKPEKAHIAAIRTVERLEFERDKTREDSKCLLCGTVFFGNCPSKCRKCGGAVVTLAPDYMDLNGRMPVVEPDAVSL